MADDRFSPSCPAAEVLQGTVLQPQPIARCHIGGLIQMADGSPCCGAYTACPIWQGEKQRVWRNQRHRKADRMLTAEGSWT